MRLVILDGHPINPGDLSWSQLEGLAEVIYYPRTATDEVVSRLASAEAVLTNKVSLTREIFAACPKLRYVGVCATGYNIIDLEAARAAGVTVTNVPGYSTDSVAQLVFALLLEITHRVGHHAARVAEGAWSRQSDFSFSDFRLIELAGRTMGIVGFGQIGQSSRTHRRCLWHEGYLFIADKKNIVAYHPTQVELPELLRESDVISLHCALTPETRNLIAWPQLITMKPSAILINTARGPLVNEADLARALRENIIAWAGLDVLSTEPPRPDDPLLSAPRVFVLPHIAWASTAARGRLMHEIAENFRSFSEGRRRNVVS